MNDTLDKIYNLKVTYIIQVVYCWILNLILVLYMNNYILKILRTFTSVVAN